MVTPYSGMVLRLGELVIGYENLVIILGTAVLCLSLWLFFRFSRYGMAMQAASESARRILCRHTGETNLFARLGLGCCNSGNRWYFNGANFLAVYPMIGFIGIKAFAAAIVEDSVAFPELSLEDY